MSDRYPDHLRRLAAEVDALARGQKDGVRHVLGVVAVGIRTATSQAELERTILMGAEADKIHGLQTKLTSAYGDTAAAKTAQAVAEADRDHYKAKADLYDAALAAGKIKDDADVAAEQSADPAAPTDPTPPADTTAAGTGTDTVTTGGDTTAAAAVGTVDPTTTIPPVATA